VSSAQHPEQRCSTCPGQCRTRRRASCRTNFGLLPSTLFGIRFGGLGTKKRGDSSPPPRRPSVVPEVKSHGRLNRPPSPNEKRCERVVGSGSSGTFGSAGGGGAGGTIWTGTIPSEAFDCWDADISDCELSRKNRDRAAELWT